MNAIGSTPVPDEPIQDMPGAARMTNAKFFGRKELPPISEASQPVSKEFPRLMYHPTEPRWQPAMDVAGYEEAKRAGWLDEPLLIHREHMQGNGKPLPTAGSKPEAVAAPVEEAKPKAKK